MHFGLLMHLLLEMGGHCSTATCLVGAVDHPSTSMYSKSVTHASLGALVHISRCRLSHASDRLGSSNALVLRTWTDDGRLAASGLYAADRLHSQHGYERWLQVVLLGGAVGKPKTIRARCLMTITPCPP